MSLLATNNEDILMMFPALRGLVAGFNDQICQLMPVFIVTDYTQKTRDISPFLGRWGSPASAQH